MNKITKILIALVAVALVFTVAFVGTLLWLQSGSSSSAKQKSAAKKEKTTIYKIADPITVNLFDDPRVNLRVSVALENVTDKTFDEELKANDALASTVIITVLRGKKVAEVSAPDAPLKFRDEIVKELNKAYQTDKFVGVYFKEFIYQ